MKKSIPDLLDCYEYNPLKVKVEPVVSAEKIKELTMKNITYTAPRAVNTRPRRTFAAALIAAVMIAALCGVAYAANIFGIREYFGEVFGRSGTEMSENDLQILENLGAEGMPSAVSNGTTMAPLAAVYDGKEYYLALKVTAPEGTVLDCGESFWQIWGYGDDWNIMYTLETPDGEAPGIGSSAMFSDDTPGDNELTIIMRFTRQFGSFGDGESLVLTIPGLWLQSPDKEYTQILSGEWSFDIGKYGVSGTIPGAEDETYYMREAYKNIFVYNYNSSTPEELAAALGELRLYGANGMPAAVSNGTTMMPIAAVYSMQFYYLALEVTAPEGVSLDEGNGLWSVRGDSSAWTDNDWLEQLQLQFADGKRYAAIPSVHCYDETPGDNKLTLIVTITLDANRGYDGGESLIFRIPGLWLQASESEYTQVLSGEWEFDIGKFGVPGEE